MPKKPELVCQAKGKAGRVPLTPLIDVVFILLVFFMLETRFLEPGAMELHLPDPGGTGSSQGTALMLELHANGEVWLNGSRVEKGGLSERLEEHRVAPRGVAVVASDATVPLQEVVNVFDVLQLNGWTEVSLVQARKFE